MSHETLLSMESVEGARDIFEAHNGVPLFWYCLLDQRAIEETALRLRRAWLEESNAYCGPAVFDAKTGERRAFDGVWDVPAFLYDHQGLAEMKLERADFLRNAQEARPYIENKLPSHLALYDDFIGYLDKTLPPQALLCLWIYIEDEHASPYADQQWDIEHEAFIHETRKIIGDIKNGVAPKHLYHDADDMFTSLTGHDGFLGDSFKDHSPDYCAAVNKEKEAKAAREALAQKVKKKERRKEIIDAVGMFSIGGGFTFVGVGMFITQGAGFGSIGAGILGLLSVAYGIAHLAPAR
jgi:hypothetical protein